MTLMNDRQLANTREKLRELESLYAELGNDADQSHRVRQLSSNSIKKLINQLKEEIARYEAHQLAR